MILLLGVIVAVCFLAYYFLIIEPTKRIAKFAKHAESLGYKAKLMPYQFMRYFLIKYLRQDQKTL